MVLKSKTKNEETKILFKYIHYNIKAALILINKQFNVLAKYKQNIKDILRFICLGMWS